MAEDSVNTLRQQELKYNGWRQAQKTITFAGGTTNAIGDFGGTQNPFTIFEVTGDVLVKVIGICTTDLAGATGTLEVGVVGGTATLIALTTGTSINANELWHDATPDAFVEASSVMAEKLIANGKDIVGTVGTADITAGVIRFICLWKRLSSNGIVVAA